VRRIKAGLLPRLDGAVTYGWLENETPDLDVFADWSATLQLSLPVDARGEVRGRLAAARARAEAAEIALAGTRIDLEQELGRTLAELHRSRASMTSAEEALVESEARRGLLERQHEVGLADLLDLIDADTTLATAEVEVAAARSSFLTAVARLELVWPDADPPDGGLIP
jgi:outer membrane protein TolC